MTVEEAWRCMGDKEAAVYAKKTSQYHNTTGIPNEKQVLKSPMIHIHGSSNKLRGHLIDFISICEDL